jgi:hypothetical protein
MLTLTNAYHNTEVRVRPRADGTISHRQVLRARAALCGLSDCRCAEDEAGTRGGEWMVIPFGYQLAHVSDERYWLVSNRGDLGRARGR